MKDKERFRHKRCPKCKHWSDFIKFEASDSECDEKGYIERYVFKYLCLNCLNVFEFGIYKGVEIEG